MSQQEGQETTGAAQLAVRKRVKTLRVVPALDAAVDGHFTCLACHQAHVVVLTEQTVVVGGTGARGRLKWHRILFQCPVVPTSDAYVLLVPLQLTAEKLAKGRAFALEQHIGMQWTYLLA